MSIDPLFAENASPEAIRAELKKARGAENRARKRADELADLLADRMMQVKRGEWPATSKAST